MFKFGKSSKNKKFDFYVHPASATMGHAGRMWGTYEFEQCFNVPCTLYQEGKTKKGQFGPFDKKWLMISVQDLDVKQRDKSSEPLGRVVINLSDFAAEDGRMTQAFTVACSRSISAAVGEAKLLVTIGCMMGGGKGGARDSSAALSSQHSSNFESGVLESEGDMSAAPSFASTPMSSAAHHAATEHDNYFPTVSSARSSDSMGDHDVEPGTAQSRSQHAHRGDAASDADSEDDLLNQAVAAMEEKKDFKMPQKRQQEPAPQQQQQPRRGLFTGKQPLYSSSKPLAQREAVPEAEHSSRSLTLAPAAAAAAAVEGGSSELPHIDAETNPFASPSEDTSNPFITVAPQQINAPTARVSEELPEPNPFITEAPVSPVTPTEPLPSQRSIPPTMPAYEGSERRPRAGQLSGTSSGWKPRRGGAHTRIGSRESVFYDEDAEVKAAPMPTGDRVERGATPRRLASELGSQANSMSAVPPLPSSMLRFSGQQAIQLTGKTLPSPEQPEPAQFEESVQSKPSRGPSQAAGPSQQQQQQEKQQQPPSASQLPAVAASIGAGAAVGVAAASAAKPLAAEGPNHESKASTAKRDAAEYSLKEKTAMFEQAAGARAVTPDLPAKATVVPPSVFAKEQPASSAPRNEAPQRTEPEPLLEEAPGSAQSKASRMLDDTQVSKLRSAITGRGRAGEGASSSASSSDTEGDLAAGNRPYRRQKSPLAAQQPVVDPFDEVFGSRGSSPDRPPRQQPNQLPHEVGSSSRQSPQGPSPHHSGSALQQQPPQAPLEARRSTLTDEDREDLKIFEEGVSHPKASHAAWSAAASSLQMRSALPEDGTTNGDGVHRVEKAVLPGAMSEEAIQLERLQKELRTVAALEAAVYTARAGKGSQRRIKARTCHAPARRLARTTISLGPDEGILFGLRAIRAVEAAAESASDVVGRAFWWSNCIQLRWMLWAMSHGGSLDSEYGQELGGSVDDFDWVMQVLVPPLRELEGYVFEQLLRQLWRNVLLEATFGDTLAGASAAKPILPSKHRQATREEQAVQRWLQALQGVQRALLPAASAATSGHVTLLKQKALTAILRRLDALLFGKLLGAAERRGSAGDLGLEEGRGAFSDDWDSMLADGNIALDPELLPFPRGRFSFGVGVNLKMAVSRWTNWAADVGLREENMGAEEGYMLFPCLRATADLLMMPKEVLTDRAIRAEVVPGLSLRRICQLLNRFLPDDFAPDPLPPGLLDALNNETPPSEPAMSPTNKLHAAYEPISEAELLADGLIEPVSLEMDDESEDEVEALSEMYDPDCSSDGTYRFVLLKELWASAR
ncbi:g6734 [Coccomyxa viridis]|uniref:G6734 protein n=1 Tax=Coccomyxa viridis TaxID=1274662 RepID=A0ABP1FW40_9CHLO